MYTVAELTGVSAGIWAVVAQDETVICNTVSAESAETIALALSDLATLRAERDALRVALAGYLAYCGDDKRDPDFENWDDPREHPVMIARAALAGKAGA